MNGTTDKNIKIEEYKLLREEIKYFMEKDTTLFTCLFSSVTAVLFFAIEWNLPESVLLAFLIIIPISGKLAYHQKEMAKISAYMQKYLEPSTGIQWERFLVQLSEKPDRPRTARYLKFSESMLMSIASFVVYVYLAYKNNLPCDNSRLFWTEMIILLALFIWSILISKEIYKIKQYKTDYLTIMGNIRL